MVNFTKISLFVFSMFLIFNAFANVKKYEVMIDGKLVVFYDSDCSETTLCADGYTTTGLDGFGNPRDFVYPQRKVSYEEYSNAIKSYNHEGYDQYGFDREEKNKEGIYAKNAVILINVFSDNK